MNQLGEALAAMKERAERAEAQVQRVRELCNSGTITAPRLTEPEKEWNRALQTTLHVLDGDA